MTAPRWKFWGWGYEGSGLTPDETRRLLQFYADRFGLDDAMPRPPPTVDDVALPRSRLEPPGRVARLCSNEPYQRLVHTYGKSFPDAVRAFAHDFDRAPDVVARPQSEDDVAAVLEWAADAGAAVIPFGGGSSVVGGVEPAVDGFAGTISLDLKGLDRVLEVDRTSRAARIQGGILGPALEAALKPHDLTLRHFPQSFECSTLGGWIATRSGGHFATLYTHIDDFVESLRVVTPAGIMESRRLPGSGAGPSPDRLMIGAEGALGVITEAWMRLQDRPAFRAGAAVAFDDFLAGARAVRAVGQAGLFPSNLRRVGRSPGRPLAGQSPAAHRGSRRPCSA
jgi:alkyldihydroxyacetonephosphate synthase